MDWLWIWATGGCATGALAQWADPDADGTQLACCAVLWPLVWLIILIALIVAGLNKLFKERDE